MADDRGERTEQPSGRRLGEARERGHVPRSAEAGPAVAVLAAAGFLTWSGAAWLGGFAALLPMTLGALPSTPWSTADAEAFGWRMVRQFVVLAGPPILIFAACKVAVNLLQVGFVFSLKPLAPNLDKLNPITGLKNLLGTRALVDLAKAPLKLALFGLVAYGTIKSGLVTLLSTGATADPRTSLAIFGSLVTTLLWRLGAVHLALAAADYGYQRWSHRRSLRMTREEVKEETRQAEGDPAIRARFKSLHRQYAMRRMMQDVATADVVVTNPTHYAVALRYDPAAMKAPTVVAKGVRLIALQIRERAVAAGVPIVEHKPLAQALYKAVPVGAEIPSALYRAVAEILAYVWSLGRRRARP
jgi:flagellar biosynthetic protein FlhB